MDIENGSGTKFAIQLYCASMESSVLSLWQSCKLIVPWNDPKRDIEMKTAFQPNLFFVGVLGDKVVATAMAGYDGHRGTIFYLAVHPDHQRKGFGAQMVDHVATELHNLGCPKINIEIRAENESVALFYEKCGFFSQDLRCMGKWLKHGDL